MVYQGQISEKYLKVPHFLTYIIICIEYEYKWILCPLSYKEPSNSWFLSPEKIYFMTAQNFSKNIWWEWEFSLLLQANYIILSLIKIKIVARMNMMTKETAKCRAVR